MAKEKIYIPTYISSVDYQPARVLPRLLYWNDTKQCDDYYINSNGTASIQQKFPYFDNYSGANTTQGSNSLLFNNEVAPYGEIPSGSLYTEYWENYVNLLYNPRTRLINASTDGRGVYATLYDVRGFFTVLSNWKSVSRLGLCTLIRAGLVIMISQNRHS
jgi:hypothetical protein